MKRALLMLCAAMSTIAFAGQSNLLESTYSAEFIDSVVQESKSVDPAAKRVLTVFSEFESKDKQIEWRILGPAVAWHASENGAAIITPASKSTLYCVPDSENPCRVETIPQKSRWSNSNPGIGLEASFKSGETTRDRVFGTLVRDSYGSMSLMAGAGRAWQIGNFDSVKLEVGASAGIWYRSVATEVVGGKKSYCFENNPAVLRNLANTCFLSKEDYFVTQLNHVFVPFVLPFASITTSSGLGINIAIAPRLKIAKFYIVPTTTIMIQSTYKF